MQVTERLTEAKPDPASDDGADGVVDWLETDIERIMALYRQAGRSLRAADPANWAAGLTMPQVRALFWLGRHGQMSVGQLAAGLGVSQPSATETLDRLVRAGLVERTHDPTDRRIVRSSLTPKGRELTDRPWETRRAVLATALRESSPDQRAEIARGLELLCKALAVVESTVFAGDSEKRENN
jgi:DNA-binding MarR family transcriptional regulator